MISDKLRGAAISSQPGGHLPHNDGSSGHHHHRNDYGRGSPGDKRFRADGPPSSGVLLLLVSSSVFSPKCAVGCVQRTCVTHACHCHILSNRLPLHPVCMCCCRHAPPHHHPAGYGGAPAGAGPPPHNVAHMGPLPGALPPQQHQQPPPPANALSMALPFQARSVLDNNDSVKTEGLNGLATVEYRLLVPVRRSGVILGNKGAVSGALLRAWCCACLRCGVMLCAMVAVDEGYDGTAAPGLWQSLCVTVSCSRRTNSCWVCGRWHIVTLSCIWLLIALLLAPAACLCCCCCCWWWCCCHTLSHTLTQCLLCNTRTCTCR